ncbi:hypothetical protein, partial [Bacillus amyloliquefaciens]
LLDTGISQLIRLIVE